MYGEPDKAAKAKEYRHMTFAEAAQLGKKAQPKAMWLTHFSPSLVYPEQYLEDARKIFPAIETGKDGKTVELKFDE